MCQTGGADGEGLTGFKVGGSVSGIVAAEVRPVLSGSPSVPLPFFSDSPSVPLRFLSYFSPIPLRFFSDSYSVPLRSSRGRERVEDGGGEEGEWGKEEGGGERAK